ncbi:ABC transporter permease [Hyphobacterium sp. CCMP332]|nr:ABC transporter permease [Hyphobacterium sp. CCMP332]
MILPVLGIVLLLTMILGHYAGEIPPYLLEDDTKRVYSEEQVEQYKEKSGLNEAFFYISINKKGDKYFYYPHFKWNGSKNRFHRYLSNFILGNLGYSNFYKSNVWDVIKLPILRTVIINIIVLIFVYSAGLYLGFYQVLKHNSIIGKSFNVIGQVFYAIPSFWLAILLLWLLANSQNFYLFPTNGWVWNTNHGIIYAILNLSWSLVLPVICLSLGSVIYIASIFQQKMKEETKKSYFKALLSRGFSRKYILRKHVFRIALIPVVAVSTDLIPGLISGSVIIESIFNIPGMGRMAFQAFFTKDYQIIYAITLMATVLTWLNWILADYIYSKLDPRVQF